MVTARAVAEAHHSGRRARAGLCGVLLATALSCTAPGEDGTLHIAVSVAPQRDLVRQLAEGSASAVEVLVPPGVDHHTYEPRPEQLRALSRARLYVRLRLEFENAWLPRLRGANRDLLIIDGTEGMDLLTESHEEADSDETGHAEHQPAHRPEHPDPHVWLSPTLHKIQARNITRALVRVDPAHRATYERNLGRTLARLDATDRYVRAKLSPLKNRLVLVQHPAWAYFAREYRLNIVAIETEGREPTGQELARLIERGRAAGVRLVFADPAYARGPAETVARGIPARVDTLDPMREDWDAGLRAAADAIALAATGNF